MGYSNSVYKPLRIYYMNAGLMPKRQQKEEKKRCMKGFPV